MSKTVMCDRCEKVVKKRRCVKLKGSAAGYVFLDVPGEFHLCRECCNSFNEWIDYEGVYTKREKKRAAKDGN